MICPKQKYYSITHGQPLLSLATTFDQTLAHFRHNTVVRNSRGAFSGNHKNIFAGAQVVTPAAEELADAALDTISHHGVTDFAADGNAQSAFATFVFAADDYEMGGVDLPAGVREPQEFRAFSQAGRFRKFLSTPRHSPALTAARVSAAPKP